MKLKIISYNIHSGVGVDGIKDYERIGRFLKNTKADFVCLQEVDFRHSDIPKADIINSLKQDAFPYFIMHPAITSELGNYGNAILSKHVPFSKQAIDVSVMGRQARNMQLIEFTCREKTFNLINTHFGLKRHERDYQLTLLAQLMEKLSKRADQVCLAVGDFNEWLPITKRTLFLDRRFCSAKLGATFPNRFPMFKLDRAWLVGQASFANVRVLKNSDTRVFSDHFPIEIELRYAGAREVD